MKSRLPLILLWATALRVFAQVTDDFSDGNFTRDPKWTGDTARFTVNNQRLQLTATAASGSASLTTANSVIFLATWEFSLDLQFNTSGSNYARFYLVSDQSDLNGPLNGYFVQIGSTTDDVSLYRQTGTNVVRIIDGLDGRINFSTVNARIRVSTDDESNWKLETDTGAIGMTGNFAVEGVCQDASHLTNRYSGLRCVYTSTRADKFFLDDVRCTGQPWPDRQAPAVVFAKMNDSITVNIRFSEPLHPESVSQAVRYGPDLQTVTAADEGTSVVLKLKLPVEDGETIYLSLIGISDKAGNVMPDTLLEVFWLRRHIPSPGDVIINEVMADPTPVVGLPETEYVELFNRGSAPFNLQAWNFGDASTLSKLPTFILRPGKLVSIVPETSPKNFPGDKITIKDFPSFNNSGDAVVLQDSAGRGIDEVHYLAGWHLVSEKENGGWSLERIDPRNICDDPENWTSSIDPSGGTPGRSNSVLASNPDLEGPRLINPVVTSEKELQVDCDERIDRDTFTEISIHIEPAKLIDTFLLSDDLRRIIIRLRDSLEMGKFHQLTIDGLRDCPGNLSSAPHNKVRFIRPFTADSMDVVINEVLFDPHPGGVDFVELFNRSGKYLELRNWRIGNGTTDSLANPRLLQARLICPGCFVVLSPDAAALRSMYPAMPDSTVMEMSLPSMPDDEGTVALTTAENKPMDELNYERDWHMTLIRSPEGVSLERLSAWHHTQNRNNWRSAGSGWGTPGQRNSGVADSSRQAGAITVDPEVIERTSGKEFALIKYSFPDGGLVAHSEILDFDGYVVRTLANNEPVGAQGFFRWDLDRDDGRPLRPGFYVVLTEVFDATGFRRLFRSRLIVLP